MADDFKPGDTVMLKSGGPHMTVTKVDGDRVWCEWFDEKKKPTGRYFEKVILRRSKAD